MSVHDLVATICTGSGHQASQRGRKGGGREGVAAVMALPAIRWCGISRRPWVDNRHVAGSHRKERGGDLVALVEQAVDEPQRERIRSRTEEEAVEPQHRDRV